MSKHENDIRLTSCDKGKRQMASAAVALAAVFVTPFVVPLVASLMVVLGIGSAAATAIVAVAWLGSAAVGMIFLAAAPLTSAIQSMIGILGTSGAAAW